eukprot:TRINITY_DN18651_c0_g1_i1.p1 TRINITY_DN18651_c0_g1~~TRINITY_DN18651_c0_g1_i1.p1  ORF type:complete len:522 (+),score=51.54 TRINITY_DN18651_c0_g1_i1:32-1597(+)
MEEEVSHLQKREAVNRLRCVAGRLLDRFRMCDISVRLQEAAVHKIQQWWRVTFGRIRARRMQATLVLGQHIKPLVNRIRVRLRHKHVIISFYKSKRAAVTVSMMRKSFIERRLYCRFAGLIEGKRTRDHLRTLWMTYQEQLLLFKRFELGARNIANRERADRVRSPFAPPPSAPEERQPSVLSQQLASIDVTSSDACLKLHVITIQVLKTEEKRGRLSFLKTRIEDLKLMHEAHRMTKAINKQPSPWRSLIVQIGICTPTLLKRVTAEGMRECDAREVVFDEEQTRRHAITERCRICRPSVAVRETACRPNTSSRRNVYTPEVPTTPPHNDFHVPRQHQRHKERVLLAAKMWQLNPEALWSVLGPVDMRVTITGKKCNPESKRIPDKLYPHCPTPPPRRSHTVGGLIKDSPIPVMKHAMILHDAALEVCSDRYFGTSLEKSVDVQINPPKLVLPPRRDSFSEVPYRHVSTSRFYSASINRNYHKCASSEKGENFTPRTHRAPQSAGTYPRWKKRPGIRRVA